MMGHSACCKVILVTTLAFGEGAAAQQPAAKQPEPATTVTNGTHRVDITGVAKTQTILGNVRPRTPGAVFLMVNIKTADPCFNADSDQPCLGVNATPLDKVRIACGEVEAAGNVYEADGGGLIDGKLACGFVVPAETMGVVRLRLRGYPELKLDIKK